MDEEGILKSLSNTEVCERIKKIRKVYETLEKKQKKFCNCFAIHCKDGCGECCEHFNPDVTEVEAEYLAYGLIVEGIDEQVLKLLETKEDNDEYCPFYNFLDVHHHCSIYKWRPLICRLFGASASNDKEGNPAFRQCKWNDNKNVVTTECLEKHKNSLVLMADFGLMIDEIETGNRETEMVKEAVPKAINKIRFMLELEQLEQIEQDKNKQ